LGVRMVPDCSETKIPGKSRIDALGVLSK
jgi:hypothetical protein